MMRLLVGFLLAVLPGLVMAACSGQDLRAQLSADERAEIARAVAATSPKAGNHWRATRDGRVIHLIGTLHIADARLDPIATRLAPLVARADVLLVEADAKAQAALATALVEDPTLAFLNGPTLIDLLSPEDWRAISQAASTRGIPTFMAAKFQPWYLSMMLSMAPCVMQSVQSGATGLDAALEAAAVAAGTPVRALEPFDTVFRLFAEDPLEVQLDILRMGGVPSAAANDAHVTLVAQYLEENLAEALATSRVIGRRHVDLPRAQFDALYDETMIRVLDRRNAAWITPIEAAEGDLIVVAAGALHLTGPQGLVQLLADRGYTLERLDF